MFIHWYFKMALQINYKIEVTLSSCSKMRNESEKERKTERKRETARERAVPLVHWRD
jgi:hypothetical protein